MSFIQVLILGAIAGFTIYLGLPIAALTTKPKMRAFLNALSVGVLVFLLIEIAFKSLEMVEEAAKAGVSGAGLGEPIFLGSILVVGLSLGLLGLTFFEEHFIGAAMDADPAVKSKRVSMMIAIAIGIHNFSEGLAIGQEYASGAISLAILLLTGFALHNATEGFGIAAPLRLKKIDWKFLALVGFIGGAPTFLGTLLGSFYVSQALELLFLTVAAGAILYIVGELIHLGKRQGQHRMAMVGILIGFFLAYGSELVIDIGITISANRSAVAKTVAVQVSEYEFVPSTLSVTEGEAVRFVVKNTGKKAHEFEIKAFGVEAVIPPGKSVNVTVHPGKIGVYNLLCDIPGHLERGMRGELIVRPKRFKQSTASVILQKTE
ncbi:MAG: hypothetical protein BMS9Abin23_0958 [Thermodesulfobacteriota bacterium]|nr:MAG: hypothetical protein BMS9Abin23_0958 [Thermodesulfobacteriota bacterium]